MGNFILPKIAIYLESGQLKEIKSVNDLPYLTTGLLEVNLLRVYQITSRKPGGRRKLNHYGFDKTAEFELLYLYFLQNCEWSGNFSERALAILYEMFQDILKVGSLNNIEDGQMIDDRSIRRKLYDQKLDTVLRIKESLLSLNDTQRNVVSDLYKNLAYKIDHELTAYTSTPPPIYFQKPKCRLPKHMHEYLETEWKDRRLGNEYHSSWVRKSILKISLRYGNASNVLKKLLCTKDEGFKYYDEIENFLSGGRE